MSCGSAGFHRANKPFQEKKSNTGKFSSTDLTITKGHWQVSDSRDEAFKGTVWSTILVTMSKAPAEPPSKPLSIFVE